ncbi:uncharacterized protein [Porites lutea]|uniref:uncharacterized protein isoform X2 n=1 Tax=Porites lutea TaxID=51062 RepID=UPI003CC62DBD
MASQMVAYILNIFRTMLPIKWIRCVLFPTLLFSSQQYPGADASGNSTNYRCCCIYEGKVYNLAPLQKDGPRFFEAVDTLNWEYAYSPCRSFSKDEPCPVGDVAVCRWDKSDPKGDHEIIGCQSKFSCGIDKPQLEYTAIKNPDWKAIIRLECNPSLDKPDDAKFEVLQDNTTTYVFSLSHKCACPNGCPEEIPTSTIMRKIVYCWSFQNQPKLLQ